MRATVATRIFPLPDRLHSLRSGMRFLFCMILIVGSLAPLTALQVGDKAPPLNGFTWIKGDPVAIGGVPTIVEFWATWCGPCRETIPHLTALQAKHGAGLRIIGVSPESEGEVRPYVQKQGAAMGYRVAVAEEKSFRAYFQGVPGPPYLFLIDKDGLVAWRGLAMDVDRPLKLLLAGKLDVAKEAKLSPLMDELTLTVNDPRADPAGIDAQVMDITERMVAIDPLNERAVLLRMISALKLQRPDVVRAAIAAVPLDLVDAELASNIAWNRINDPDPSYRNIDLIYPLACRAVELGATNPSYLDTYARVLATIGLIDEAIACEERALALAPQVDATVYRGKLDSYRAMRVLRDQITKTGVLPAARASADGPGR